MTSTGRQFPGDFDTRNEVAIRLAAQDVAVDPEHIAEAWGDGGWNESVWLAKADQMEIAFSVFARELLDKAWQEGRQAGANDTVAWVTRSTGNPDPKPTPSPYKRS